MGKTSSILASPFGPIVIAASSKGLTDCRFQDRLSKQIVLMLPQGDRSDPGAHFVQLAETQLREYFAGDRQEFQLPLDLSQGTEFQRRVWTELQRIPHGTTKSYLDVAKAIENPKAVRAVGSANNKNPVSIIVPCHRVIGNDGAMKGYGGGGVDVKRALLALEGWEPVQ